MTQMEQPIEMLYCFQLSSSPGVKYHSPCLYKYGDSSECDDDVNSIIMAGFHRDRRFGALWLCGAVAGLFEKPLTLRGSPFSLIHMKNRMNDVTKMKPCN